jgi:hypothetical protein
MWHIFPPPLTGTVALIDEAFEQQIEIIENGESRRITVFEAILLQLWRKEMAGDRRATTVRLKYQEFVGERSGAPGFIIEPVYQDSWLKREAKNEG